MAETQDTGATTPADPVSTAAAAVETPVVVAPIAAVKADPIVKIRSRLNYSIGITFSDGEELSLPAHATRTVHQSLITDAAGKQIALPRGVFVVEAE